MKLKLSIFVLLALLMASCTHDITIPEPAEPAKPAEKEGDIVIISATIPEKTRVSYDDITLKLAWEQNDTLLLAGYDAGGTYIASSKFGYTGNDNEFIGTKVPGANTYKAYYPGDVITLDDNGQVQLPANFWQQTQNGENSTAHLSKKLLMSDVDAKALNQPFTLTSQSSIVRLNLNNIPSGVGTLQKVIWTLQTSAEGSTELAILNVIGVGPGTTSLTAFFAFDPAVMRIAENGEVKVTLIGSQSSYEWSTNTTKVGGMTYEAGKRYYATVNGVWVDAKAQFRFTIQTAEANQLYEIWQKDASSTSPANLTINWGDGTPNTPIAKNASIAKTIADHTYASPDNYTITITSDQVDPTVKQMPQIVFFNQDNSSTDELLTAILDPFPNMGATDFGSCFFKCHGLTSIPAELFKYNTQADNFNRCFIQCRELTSIPAELFRYNTQARNFMVCFDGCQGLTSLPADLFRYNTQAETFSSCFNRCIGLTSIPAELFKYNTQVTNFSNCFGFCEGLTSLPADLFRYNTEVTTFYACFTNCIGLTSLPADLFKYNTIATNFRVCFQGCTKLQLRRDIFPDPSTNPGFFEGRSMNFERCFKNVGTDYPTPTGTAPKLWGFNGGGEGTTWTITDCFTGANVVNRNVIPISWGGDAAESGKVTDVDGEYW
ncbi:MAG: PKD domain-containing protein [Fermentimonas sp.]